MLRIKEFGSKLYTTHLIGFNEKYRYLFLSCNTRFVIYSLDLEKIIVETKELRWVENMTFTADWNYAVCRSFKTNKNQLADVYIIDMENIKTDLTYEYIGKAACDTVWKLSRFPSAILLARNKCIEIIDCKTKQIILEIENRFHLYKALFVNEGEIEDILEITYIGKEDRDYYGINGTSIKYFREMKQYNERYTAWKRYEVDRRLVQSRLLSGGIEINDQIHRRKIILERENLDFWEGKFSLSGDYFWTKMIRKLEKDEILPGIPPFYDVITDKRYNVLYDLRENKIVHLLDDNFGNFGAHQYYYDERTELLFVEDGGYGFNVAICKMEDSDVINQRLDKIDFKKIQLATSTNNQDCESILFKGH